MPYEAENQKTGPSQGKNIDRPALIAFCILLAGFIVAVFFLITSLDEVSKILFQDSQKLSDLVQEVKKEIEEFLRRFGLKNNLPF